MAAMVESPTTPSVFIISERCAGCTECIKECPRGCLTMDYRNWVVQVDSEACSGCRQCQRACPYQNITVSGPFLGLNSRIPARELGVAQRLGNFDEVALSFTVDEAVKEAARCLHCLRPQCRDIGCPAHNDIPAMNAAIRNRDFAGAMRAFAPTTNLPTICSRVCDQAKQCEGACVYRREGGQAVAIGKLERFMSEWAMANDFQPNAVQPASGYRVAVVGAGPAGLAAAEDLAKAGHAVTVFDPLPVAGGILAWGIPEFILPAAVVAAKVAQVQALGVQFRLGTRVGTGNSVDKLLQDGFSAVFLAAGAGKDNTLSLPGSDLKGVITATSYLSAAKLAKGAPDQYKVPATGDNMLVIGAGNTAMDVARTARRLGVKNVTAIDILSEELAPVRRDELETARAEGVNVRFAVSTKSFSGRGKVETVELVRMDARRDHTNKISTTPIPGSEFTLPVDTVVFAMGYRVTQEAIADTKGISTEPRGTVTIVGENGQTSREGVWAAGDIATGPSTVVRSMAAAKRAAAAIDQALRLKSKKAG